MRIGVMIDAQDGVQWPEWTALAQAAERAGLYSLSVSEHYSGMQASSGHPKDAMDAWTVLAALAPTTRTLRFGTLASPVTFRHPSVLARIVATIDHISGGRVELAVGAGWLESEHVQNGFPFPPLPDRFAMLEEQTEIVVRSWTEDKFDFAGRFYTLKGQQARPLATQKPLPLVIGGGAKPRSARLAAHFAQEYNVSFATPEAAATMIEAVRRACADIGREPSTMAGSIFTVGALGRTEREAMERKKRAETLTGFPPSMVASWIVGTVEQAAERLREYQKAGLSRVYFKHPDHHDYESIELMGELARMFAS